MDDIKRAIAEAMLARAFNGIAPQANMRGDMRHAQQISDQVPLNQFWGRPSQLGADAGWYDIAKSGRQ